MRVCIQSGNMKISDTVSAHVVDLCGQIVPVIDQTLNKYVAFNNQLGTEVSVLSGGELIII